MKACARVVVIEADCHVSPQRKLGGLTAVGRYFFSFFLLYLIDYIHYICEFLKTRESEDNIYTIYKAKSIRELLLISGIFKNSDINRMCS